MNLENRSELKVMIEASARTILETLVSKGFKIAVTLESTTYTSCCGGYVEKSLKIEPIWEIYNTSGFILLEGDIPIYVDKEALELIRLSGSNFTIYADLEGRLHLDQ